MRFERLRELREKSAPMVAQALTVDECDVVRHEAAFVLGDSFAQVPEMEGVLIRSALNDSSVLVRHEACLALAKFKTVNALRALLECMKDAAPEVRGSAAYAVEEMMFSK